MKTEHDIKIRKLRKKLRQIENLERQESVLSAEEKLKVARKNDIRAQLQESLSSLCGLGATSYQTTALMADSKLDSTTESKEAACWSSDEDEEEEEEGEEDKDGSAHSPEYQGNVNKDTNDVIQGLTDEEKMERHQLINTAESGETGRAAENTQASDISNTSQAVNPNPSPQKKHKVDMGDVPSSNSSEQKRQSKSKNNPVKQLQKKWSRSQWEVRKLSGHNDLVCSVSMSGKWLLSGSRDTTLKLWDTVQVKELRSMGGHTGSVTAVLMPESNLSRAAVQALSLDHHVCVSDPSLGISGSSDCSIKFWDLSTGEMLKSLYAFSPITRLAFTVWHGQACLLSGSAGGKVELWNLEQGTAAHSLRAHTDVITGLATDEGLVYSSSADGAISVHQIRDHSLHTIFMSENVKLTTGAPLLWRHIRSLAAFSHVIYYGDDAMNVKAVDWKEGVAHKLSNHTTEFGATDAIHLSRDLDLLLSSGYDLDNGLGFVNVRQLSTEKYLCSLCDEESSRIVNVVCGKSGGQSAVTIVTAGMELVLWKQLSEEQSEQRDRSAVGAQFVSYFTRPAHHSDEESENEAELSLDADDEVDEDTTTQAGEEDMEPVSLPFTGRRPAQTEDTSRGWLSWCNVL